MTNDEIARKAADINYEIVITHGMEGGVGFVWNETFIHDPFVDPQYGAFPVDPVQQYGDAYRESIFAADPAKALEMARQQLRERASEDLGRYCADRGLNGDGIPAVIEAALGVQVPESDDLLENLTDEQVAQVWDHVEKITTVGCERA